MQNKKDDYMKAVRKITELEIQVKQLEKDRSALSFKANERLTELEETCAEHLKSARKNWDAYQMEVTKTEKLQEEFLTANCRIKELEAELISALGRFR